MSLSERTIIDRVEILENGIIQVREANIIEKNGKVVARNFTRYVLKPGSDLTGKDSKVIAIANAVWTPEVVATFQAQLSSVASNSLSGSQAD